MGNRRLGGCLVAGAIALGALAPAAAADTVVVTGSDVTGDDVPVGSSWSHGDTRFDGAGTFVAGPSSPPLGTGSYELRTPANPDKVQLMTNRHAGTKLADVDGIGYWTYRDPSSTGFVAGVPSINLRVDFDADGTTDAYMVFEPYQDQGNAAVQTGVWQHWDAHRGGAARWWVSGTALPACGQATPCSWSQIVSQRPTAAIREGSDVLGSFGVNQGSFNSGLVTAADSLSLSVAGNETTYDFEPGCIDRNGADETGPVSHPLHELDAAVGAPAPPVGALAHRANCGVVVPLGL